MSSPTWIGHTLSGRYRIEALLGEGGMSSVYRAHDPNLRRSVAIKLIHPHLSRQPDFVRRFGQEAAAVAQLRHPNIIQVYDFATDGEVSYMVLEYIQGESLKARLERLSAANQRLAIPEAIRLVAGICDAAEYAHTRSMIHRDIKPANVMLDEQGQAILTDFGIVKIVGGESHTASGAIVGTAHYMSPEMIRGEELDARADLYSIGIVLFELLSGDPPFMADSAMTIMHMHLNAPVPDLRKLNQNVPSALVTLVNKALEKEPANRFQSAGELAAALRKLANASEQVATALIEEGPPQEAPRIPGKVVPAEGRPVPPGTGAPEMERRRIPEVAAIPRVETPSRRPAKRGRSSIGRLLLLLTLVGGAAAAFALTGGAELVRSWLVPSSPSTAQKATQTAAAGDDLGLSSAQRATASAAAAPTRIPTRTPYPAPHVLIEPGDPVTLALYGSITGQLGHLMAAFEGAARIALEDHGPVRDFKIRLILFDEKCNPLAAAEGAENIVNNPQIVGVLGPSCSASARAGLPTFEQHQFVVISGSATDPDLNSYGPTVFHRTVFTDQDLRAAGLPTDMSHIDRLASVQSFYAEFESRAGTPLPKDFERFAAFFYDATRMLLAAIETTAFVGRDGALVVDRVKLLREIRETTAYPGITGSITFDEQGNRVVEP